MNTETKPHPVRRAASAVGGVAALARALNLAPPTVSQWISGDRPIPTDRCIEVEKITKGAVTCEEMRPDLAAHWAYIRGTAKRPLEAAA
jgi:DNA-binding transcriptional regulator YdaS (Cro superfamily)